MRLHRPIALTLFAALAALDGGQALATALRVDYAVSMLGLPVGRARLKASFDGNGYEASFSGRLQGLARLISDSKVSATTTGSRADGRLTPETYEQGWTEDDDAESISLRLIDGDVSDIVADPPRRHPERYVAITEADKQDVLDPVSCLIWPAADGLSPDLCNRTVPLFDGRRRFDLLLSFSREETFEALDGDFSGPVIVCAVRYRPISGHRPGKKSVREMAENKDMEVWMALAGDTGTAAPVRIGVATGHGRLVIQAKHFRSE